jgi:class 3 adenylate cyclase
MRELDGFGFEFLGSVGDEQAFCARAFEDRDRLGQRKVTTRLAVELAAQQRRFTEEEVRGAVTNLASRLADEATSGQILITQRLYAEIEDAVEAEPVGEFTLKGFQRPIAAFNVLTVHETAAVSG